MRLRKEKALHSWKRRERKSAETSSGRASIREKEKVLWVLAETVHYGKRRFL